MLLFVGTEDCVSEEENEDKMEARLPCPSHGRDAGNKEEEKRGTLH